jgi:hypothetical protein
MEYNTELHLKSRQKNIIVDKKYLPMPGDILSNDCHSSVIIDRVYLLPKYSRRVDKNYNDNLFKHEVCRKIIQRKEIIWTQHKFDILMFPENVRTLRINREHMDFREYCLESNLKQYNRLYKSKYYLLPQRKKKVQIGFKTMVKINHSMCGWQLRSHGSIIQGVNRECFAGRFSVSVSYLINHYYKYLGNIFIDIVSPFVVSGQNEN